MQVVTSIITDHLSDSVAAARAAEAAGYDGVTTQENQHDPFLPLAAAAVATDRVSLITSIALAFTRSPVALAYTGWDLHVSSGGRFVLGLGSQVKGHNERRFSVPWTAPAPRIKECVDLIRATWRCWEYGDALDFAGEHYKVNLMPPNFRPKASGLGLPPILLAAVGPAMMRLCGRVADVVSLHPFCTQAYFDNVALPEIEKGLARAGRSREALMIAGGGFIATGPDEETVAKMVEFARQRVAFYGSTRSYLPVFEQHGLEDLGAKLHRMSVDGKWSEMAAEVDDDVVALFTVIGTHEHLAKAMEARFAGRSDVISETQALNAGPALPPDLIADLQRIPAKFERFGTW